MRLFTTTLLAVVIASLSAVAQTPALSMKKAGDGLYILYYDTTATKSIVTKSTVVEFSDFIALIEVPISNDGIGAVNLKDHSEGGNRVLEFLKKSFPEKPLKYVLSSHWHPHSISSILPFISRKITVVTTRANFVRLSEFVDSAAYREYGNYVQFVDGDSLEIQDPSNRIVAYRFTKKEYPNVPTQDFLYFYLPTNNCLHSSCMFQRLLGRVVYGKEMISSRVEDLHRFLETKQIVPQHVITTDTYWDGADGMISGDTLQQMFRAGITMGSIESDIQHLSVETLTTKTDSLVKNYALNGVPVNMLGRAVTAALHEKDLTRGLALARLQALVNPSDPNAWDTFGEVYYFLGETGLARMYAWQSTRIDKNFTIGGEEAWKKELENFQKEWSEKGK